MKRRSGSLEDRAKAYLHINCAHCHNDLGPAKNSGLNLTYYETNQRKRGVYKPPIAAGKGSGNLKFSIVPNEPEKSIMIYRYNNVDPGIMMPEIGRKKVYTKKGLHLKSTLNLFKFQKINPFFFGLFLNYLCS